MILVTAGYGNQARRLIPKLKAAGKHVRAVRRGPSGADAVHALGASEVIIGDLLNPAILEQAMDGVESVFHVGPSVHPREGEMGMAAVHAAAKAGVHHFVYSSVLHPIIPSLIHHQAKLQVEQLLVESAMNTTILQPGDFMETNIAPERAFETGQLSVVWNLDRGHSMIALNDLTDVDAKVLIEGRPHFGATYALCAPGCPSAHDICKMIASLTGESVSVVKQGFGDRRAGRFREEFGEEGAAYQRRLFEGLDQWLEHHDFAGNPQVLTMLLGRPPLSVKDWLALRWKKYRPSS